MAPNNAIDPYQRCERTCTLISKRIFGPKRGELTGDWRKLHNEELHNLHSSPNITRMIKSSRMRRAEHVARMGGKRNAYRILVGKARRKETIRKTKTQVGGQY
jgi:hypothetical protein